MSEVRRSSMMISSISSNSSSSSCSTGSEMTTVSSDGPLLRVSEESQCAYPLILQTRLSASFQTYLDHLRLTRHGMVGAWHLLSFADAVFSCQPDLMNSSLSSRKHSSMISILETIAWVLMYVTLHATLSGVLQEHMHLISCDLMS